MFGEVLFLAGALCLVPAQWIGSKTPFVWWQYLLTVAIGIVLIVAASFLQREPKVNKQPAMITGEARNGR